MPDPDQEPEAQESAPDPAPQVQSSAEAEPSAEADDEGPTGAPAEAEEASQGAAEAEEAQGAAEAAPAEAEEATPAAAEEALDSALAAPSEPEPAPKPASQPLQGALIALALVVALGVLAPWLLTHTALAAILRDQVRQVGPDSTVGAASLGWTDGLSLERVLVSDSGPLLVLVDRVELRTSLISLFGSWLDGEALEAKLVLGEGLVRVVTGEGPEPAEDEATEPVTLFAPLESTVELGGVDVDLSISGTRLLFRSAVGSGGFLIGEALGLSMTEPANVTCESFSLTSGGDSPSSLVLNAPQIAFTRFELPTGDAPLTLKANVQAAEAHSGELALEAVRLDVAYVEGVLHLELKATVPAVAGSLKLVLDLDTNKDRSPLTLELDLKDVPLEGELGKRLPIVLPLLQAFRGRSGEFPPVSLTGAGGLELIDGPDGSLDRDKTVDSTQAEGEVAVAAGDLGASRLVDGYARALLGLGVGGLLEGVMPNDFRFKGARGPFTIKGDTVEVPEIVLKGDAVDLAFSGKVQLSGDYSLGVQTRVHKLRPELAAIVRTLNRAGGVTLSGNLEDATCSGSLPSLDALADAAKKEGVADVLLKSPLLEPLKAKLGGGGK